MTRDDAIAVAEGARVGLQVPEHAPITGAEQVWLEVAVAGPEGAPPRVRDVLVWRVNFERPPGPSLAIDDATGEVLLVDFYQ